MHDPDSMLEADAHPQPGNASAPPAKRERRAGRFITHNLRCSLGKVLDISRDGMRVSARHVPRGTCQVMIENRNAPITVHAEVVWHRRTGLFSRTFGMRFVNVSPEIVTQLAHLARASSQRPSV